MVLIPSNDFFQNSVLQQNDLYCVLLDKIKPIPAWENYIFAIIIGFFLLLY
jgi:hypothetical protein